MPERKKKSRTGPEPDRLNIDGDWKEAVKKAVNTPPPKESNMKTNDRIIYRSDKNHAETHGRIVGPGKPEKFMSVVADHPLEPHWEVRLDNGTEMTVPESTLRLAY